MMSGDFSSFQSARGFALFSMTQVLIFIIISSSLSFAHIQQQRIQRNQLSLSYLKARITAEPKLELFYIALYDSPELFASIQPCTMLELDSRQLVSQNEKISQFIIAEQLYLCMEKEGYFNVSIKVPYSDSEQLVIQRKLITLSTPWVWQSRSLLGF